MTEETKESMRLRIAELQGELAVYRRLLEEANERAIAARVAAAGAASDAAAGPSAELVRRISDMTMKQRAVLFATLVGHEYQEIATTLGVDATTVKLHLKAALNKAGVESRNTLRITAKETLAAIGKVDANAMFGVPVNWMETKPKEVMEKLLPVRQTVPPPAPTRPNRGRK